MTYYLIAIIAIILAAVVIKKAVGCLVRLVVLLVLTGVLAYLYFNYLS